MKKKRFLTIFLVILLISASLAGYFFIKDKKVDNVQGNLIISTFSKGSKGNILLYDLKDYKETLLVTDCKVAVSGDISLDGKNVVYADALGDSDPWQIYMKTASSFIGKAKKLTDNEDGKASPRISNDNDVYFLTGDSSGIMNIGKVDAKTKSLSIINDKSSDCKADAMDIKEDKLIMSSTRNSLYQKIWDDYEGEDIAITHSLYEMNKDGSSLEKILDFQASTVSSISYTPDGRNVIMCGCDVNGNSSEGIYKISLESREIELLFNKDTFKTSAQGIISDFSSPSLAKMSLDGSLIYFTGVEDDSETIEVDGIECNPSLVYSYNVDTKEIKQVYKPKEEGFIFDLNIKY